jgi:hypothetical protein
MAFNELVSGPCLVQFFEKHRLYGKPYTVQHFVDEDTSRRTVYIILNHYEERGEYVRKTGSGRLATKMIKKRVKRLVKPPST